MGKLIQRADLVAQREDLEILIEQFEGEDLNEKTVYKNLIQSLRQYTQNRDLD